MTGVGGAGAVSTTVDVAGTSSSAGVNAGAASSGRLSSASLSTDASNVGDDGSTESAGGASITPAGGSPGVAGAFAAGSKGPGDLATGCGSFICHRATPPKPAAATAKIETIISGHALRDRVVSWTRERVTGSAPSSSHSDSGSVAAAGGEVAACTGTASAASSGRATGIAGESGLVDAALAAPCCSARCEAGRRNAGAVADRVGTARLPALEPALCRAVRLVRQRLYFVCEQPRRSHPPGCGPGPPRTARAQASDRSGRRGVRRQCPANRDRDPRAQTRPRSKNAVTGKELCTDRRSAC